MNWDDEDEKYGEATKRFHEYTTSDKEDLPDGYSRDEFEDLYRTVGEAETEDPEQTWKEWNRGSGYESDSFQTLRVCDHCDEYLTSEDEAREHAQQEHGYTDSGTPDYIHGERSMSVGDVVEIDDQYYLAAPVGFKEIDVYDEGDT